MPTLENLKHFESLGDVKEKLYDKVFGVRLPKSAAKKLLKLSTKERTLLMRRAILRELENSS